MKKYFTRGLLVSFVMIALFSFAYFVPVSKASAQSMNLCQTIEALIKAGVINADRADAARVAAGCATPVQPIEVPLNIELISNNITVENLENNVDQAVGSFRFNATAVNSDVLISKNLGEVINGYRNGLLFGKVNPSVLTSSSGAEQTASTFLVRKGETETFSINYILHPSQGSGSYHVRAVKIPIVGGVIDIDSDDSEFKSKSVYLNGPNSVGVEPTAAITNSPVLKLVYNSDGKEAQLIAKYVVSVAATSSNIYVLTNPFSVGLINDTNSNSGVRSAKTVFTTNSTSTTINIDGLDYYKISAGEILNFNVEFSVNTSELFAGSYYARLYGNWMPYYGKVLEINPTNNSSNKVTVIGEMSPYITSVTPSLKVGEVFEIKGARINSKTIAIYVDGRKIMSMGPSNILPKGDSSAYVSFVLPELSIGNHFVEVSNASGMSNKVGFEVQPSSIKPCLEFTLTRDLTVGSTGADVTALQNYLGVTPATGYFGPMLKAAVMSYQQSHGISPVDGYVGSVTRASINCSSVNKPPVINSVAAPTTLKVDEKGTWIVKASDPENGSLSYSADWGDTPATPVVDKGAVIQKSTFTHSYSSPGTYTVTFFVKDESGLSAKSSVTTKVEKVPEVITTPVCTSFAYSSWSACSSGYQSRTVISKNPSGCTDGSPVLSQSCTQPTPTPAPAPTPTKPSCSSPSCSYNGQCYPNGTVQGNYKCSNGSIVPVPTVTPTPTPAPAPTPTNPSCSSPSCSYNGQCYPNGATQSGYKCSNGKIIKVSAISEDSTYATASVGWKTFLKLLEALI